VVCLTASVVSVGGAGCNGARRLENGDASVQGVLVVSTYTSRIRFPTDTQVFRAIISREGLYSSGGAAHTNNPGLRLSI
jgi:hypothetical protein